MPAFPPATLAVEREFEIVLPDAAPINPPVAEFPPTEFAPPLPPLTVPVEFESVIELLLKAAPTKPPVKLSAFVPKVAFPALPPMTFPLKYDCAILAVFCKPTKPPVKLAPEAPELDAPPRPPVTFERL